MGFQVWEVLLKYEPARKVYERIYSRTIAQWEREIARNVTCLLLWLEMIAGIKVLADVGEMPRNSTELSRVIDEANAVHSYVLQGTYRLPPELEHLPTITGLCNGGRLVDFRFFRFHKDLVSRGLAMIRDTIAPFIFNDRLYEKLRWFQDEVVVSPVDPRPPPELLEPVVIQRRTLPADSRTVFVSFPQGPSLSPQEIKDYFEQYVFRT